MERPKNLWCKIFYIDNIVALSIWYCNEDSTHPLYLAVITEGNTGQKGMLTTSSLLTLHTVQNNDH